MTKIHLKEMANRIKARRIELKFTQEQFSELIGLSTSSYTKIENAFQTPSIDTLIKIVTNLDISLDYIVFGIDRFKPKQLTNSDLLNSILEFSDIEKINHTKELLNKISELKKDM